MMSENHLMRAERWWHREAQSSDVKGYLHPVQAKALGALMDAQMRAGLQGSLAEIGVYQGKTLIGLTRASQPDERVLGVDPLRLGQTDLMPGLERNLHKHLQADERARLLLERRLSTDLTIRDWMNALGQPARFVHLDGHHAYETILHDFRLAASWLVKGGIVVFDDFLNELHPDLTRGMLEALTANTQLVPVAVIPRVGHIEEGGSKLVCTTPSHKDDYLKALDDALSPLMRPWQDELLGRPVRVYRHPMPTRVAQAPIVPAAVDHNSAPQKKSGAAGPAPIVFALHDLSGHYWVQTAVAMASVAQHAQGTCRFHVLHDHTLTVAARERMQTLSRQMGFELNWHDVELPASVMTGNLRQFGPGALFRLMIPQLFAREEQVIYLDSDLVCNGLDMATLTEGVNPAAPIAAVPDPFMSLVPQHAHAIEAMGLETAQYFNSGVMLWRPPLIQENLLQAFAKFMESHPQAIHPDQDFLNLYFAGRAAYLPPRFNTQAGLMQGSLVQPLSHYQAKVIHYAGKLKPLDGILSPGVLPFWMHALAVPEAVAAVGHTHYLYPLMNQPHGLRRSRLQAVD